MPTFSEKQIEVMKGLLLGDADIKSGTSGSIFRIRITNKEFLNWLDDFLSPLSRGVRFAESGDSKKEKAINNNLSGVTQSSEFKDMYSLRTVTHPQINQLYNWYKSGQKRFPNTITTEMFKMWYICDGWKHPHGVRIRCVQQKDRDNEIIDLLSSLDFIDRVTYSTKDEVIRLTSSNSKTFWKSTKAPKGFNYKWPQEKSKS